MYYIDSFDGTKLSVEDINPNAETTVLLVHGWPISKEMYEYQKDVLRDMGYRIVSFDMRGFGDSQVSGDNYDYDSLAKDLNAVIEKTGRKDVILIGFSMGGAVCVHYMGMFDNKNVSKLILLGAAAPSFTATTQNPYGNTISSVNDLIEQTIENRPEMIKKFGKKVFARNHGNEFLTWFQNLCLKGSGIGTIETAISLRDEDVFSDLSKIKVPTYIMHGKLDKICPYGFAKIMNEQIKDSKLIPFEYSGHGLFFDEREKCNQEILYVIDDSLKRECDFC